MGLQTKKLDMRQEILSVIKFRTHTMKIFIRSIQLVFLIFLVSSSISCNKKPTESNMGIIHVLVVDNDAEETPIPNVRVMLTPGAAMFQVTDANGICSFEIESGNYYVDADVCCAGPGFIEYHESVTVVDNETAEVKLVACLRCL